MVTPTALESVRLFDEVIADAAVGHSDLCDYCVSRIPEAAFPFRNAKRVIVRVVQHPAVVRASFPTQLVHTEAAYRKSRHRAR